MKYIQYTYVDVKTNKPVSQEPARRGPTHPEGITPTFAVEDSYSTGVPVFYGIAEDDFQPEDWMVEVNEDDFFTALKTEFKERARVRRKQVEQGGIEISEGLFVRTDIESQNRIASLVATVNNDPDLVEIDFEAFPGQWLTFTSQQAIEIGKAVSRHVQHCFTWCKSVHEEIETVESLEDALPIALKINSFGVTEEIGG